MLQETIDLVNENDEIIGQTTKEEAHLKGLFHRVTAVLIINDKGQIALQKRSRNIIGGGLLDHSAAGHVPIEESYETAALRELSEELGIKVSIKKIDHMLKELWHDKDKNNLKHIYSLFIGNHNGPFILQESEVESVEFYDIEKISEMIKENPENFTTGMKLSFKSYLDWRNQNGNTN